MTVTILQGDVRERLRDLPDGSVHCVVTSPPYWGLRDYGVEGQIGLERCLGEHIALLVDIFREVRRVLAADGTFWLNYGDCYATQPNGRSAAATKAAGKDDRTFRDKPFSTIGPIYDAEAKARGRASGKESRYRGEGVVADGRIVAGGALKAGDMCMIPERLVIALQEDGWCVRSRIIWGKSNTKPDSSGRFRPSYNHEMIWLLAKGLGHFYDAKAVRQPTAESTRARLSQDIEAQTGSFRQPGKTNGAFKAVGDKETRLLRAYEPAPAEVWHMKTASFRDAHFATFPPELVERCLKAGCPDGGVVLDPFFGAGTTGLVAQQFGRNCIGIELNPEYVEIAKRRLGLSPASETEAFAEVIG